MTTLPYTTTAGLKEQGGASVAGAGAIKCSIWPATSSRNSTTGRQHTHGGEADFAHAVALRVPNRTLTAADGEVYKIVAATAMPYVKHVVLELLLTSGWS